MTAFDPDSGAAGPAQPVAPPGTRLAAGGTDACGSPGAIDRLYRRLVEQLGGPPDLIVGYHTADASAAVDQWLATAEPVRAIGVTSCQQIMTQEGVIGDPAAGSGGNQALGLLAIKDSRGSYGAAVAEAGDPRSAARSAYFAALDDAGRPGELPDLVLLHTVNGAEEPAIATIDELTGGNCPVVGGSVADDGPGRHGSCFVGPDRQAKGLALAVLFPSTGASAAFQSGYVPTGHAGTLTRVAGRVIHEIDGQPAAEVYNRWVNGAFDEALASGDSRAFVESKTWCLSREIGRADVGGTPVPYFVLFDPAGVTDEHGLRVHADLSEGQLVHLMTGDASSLPRRSAHVVQAARAGGTSKVAGGLVSYCAGYRFAPEVQLADVHQSLASAFDGAPFLLTFAFGEQGSLLGGENLHGNLMVSAATFTGI